MYINATTFYSVVVERGKTLNMKYGSLKHEYLIGKRQVNIISKIEMICNALDTDHK